MGADGPRQLQDQRAHQSVALEIQRYRGNQCLKFPDPRRWSSHSYEEVRAIIDDYVENKLFADIEKTPKRKSHKKEDICR